MVLDKREVTVAALLRHQNEGRWTRALARDRIWNLNPASQPARSTYESYEPFVMLLGPEAELLRREDTPAVRRRRWQSGHTRRCLPHARLPGLAARNSA